MKNEIYSLTLTKTFQNFFNLFIQKCVNKKFVSKCFFLEVIGKISEIIKKMRLHYYV